jgi:azurin
MQQNEDVVHLAKECNNLAINMNHVTSYSHRKIDCDFL